MDTELNNTCESLWREYEPQVRKICRIKLMSCPHEADDVISEVFLALCRTADANGLPEKPRQWIYGTLNNIINLKYREIYKLRDKQGSIESRVAELPFDESGIEDKIEEIYNGEIKDKLKTLLSDDEFIIINYIYFRQLKMKEVAELIGSTESAVKQKHYRICRKLRKTAQIFEKNH